MTQISQNLAATFLAPEDAVDEIAVLRFVVKRLLAKMETMIPVKVTKIHPGAGSPPAPGKVDVQPLLTMLDAQGNVTEPGIVSGLPVQRLQGGPWAIICDPAVGDFGYIVAASRDVSNVVKTPGIRNPGSFRQYSYSDSVYVPGILNAVPAASLWLKSDGTMVLTTKDGVVVKSDGSGNLSMADSHTNTITTSSTGIIASANGTSIEVNHSTQRCNIVAVSGLWVNGVQVTVP